MEKNIEMAMLLDIYGEVLTEKQRDVVDLYYNEDMSLGEIAQNSGITRQGVRDFIKRSEITMTELEEKLGLVAKFNSSKRLLAEMSDNIEFIEEYNSKYVSAPQIKDWTNKIKNLVERLEDNF